MSALASNYLPLNCDVLAHTEKNVSSQLPFKQRPLKIFIFQTFLVKVTHSLSELHRPLVTLSLSSAKRTFLYHDSSASVLDSLPAGHPYPSRSLCGLFFWLTEWCSFMNHVVRFPNWHATFCHPDISIRAYKCHAVESLPWSENWNSCHFFGHIGANSRIFKERWRSLCCLYARVWSRYKQLSGLRINHS